jgi:hypothetical protein
VDHRRAVSARLVIGALAALSAALPLGLPARASAQEVKDFNAQRFSPAPGPRNFFMTRGARTDGEMAWSAGLFVDYANEPLVVASCVGSCDPTIGQSTDLKVVENLVVGDIVGSLTPIPMLQIGLRVPLAYSKGHGLAADGGPDKFWRFGMADPELEAKARFFGESKDTLVLGGALYGTAPLGNATADRAYIGDETPTGGLRAIVDVDLGLFSLAANVGGALRGTVQLPQSETKIGSEMRWGLAAGVRPSPLLRIVVDSFGSTRFTSTAGESAIELTGGAQLNLLKSALTINAGAGTSLVYGVGTPVVRALVGAVYSFEQRDRDEDGLDDSADQCPTEAEDLDSYEDSDGCPDPDNDLDTIPDTSDKCPGQAEDADGFEDTDGCPELDNDKDGLPDTGDRCPNEAETKNGFDDTDGCPDVSDKDRDGVPDDKDSCIDDPEDTDGFEDTDGCPDPDNDKDGIPDNQDECVDEPETFNKFEDEDGCPDERGKPKPAPKKGAAPTAPAPTIDLD